MTTCTHQKYYGSGDMRTCANPQCAVWLVPDAEPELQPELKVAIEQLQSDAPPAAPPERTVQIESAGRGKKRGKR